MRYSIVTPDHKEPVPVEVDAVGVGRYRVKIGDGAARVVEAQAGAQLVHLHAGGRSVAVHTGHHGDDLHLHADGHAATFTVLDPRAARLRARRDASGMGGGANIVASPMPGRVVKVLVAEGDRVEEGAGVAIVEAMKMENELRAGCAGLVKTVHVSAGDAVEANAKLVTLEPDDD